MFEVFKLHKYSLFIIIDQYFWSRKNFLLHYFEKKNTKNSLLHEKTKRFKETG